MKKQMLIISILLCISLFFSACANNTATNNGANDGQTTSTEGAGDTLPREYTEIINNIIEAYPWDSEGLYAISENPELSYMYELNASLSEIGFTLIDLDSNGQEELIISDANRPFVYDIYTISSGKAVHLLASGERFGFYIYEYGYIENWWSDSAATNGNDFYKLNDGKLTFVERITLDAYHALNVGLIDDLSQANNESFFFKSKSEKEADYEWITSDEAEKAIETYRKANKPLKIEYTLLSEYGKQ